MNILVTGVTGFIGSSVMTRLAGDGHHAVASAVRLSADANWCDALQGTEVVVHTAARVHVMRDVAADPLAEFRRVNVDGTLRLAQQAVAAGVKRFIFVSSIKVHGEATMPGKPFTAEDIPAPMDAYGQSKLEAELGLRAIARDSGMELVILRPPLVYGPEVKGNMASLVKLVARGWPLPLGAIYNKRSMVSRDNLVDVIARCVTHPAAANQVFLLSDGEDISTPQLIRTLAEAMGKPACLWPCPPTVLRCVARALGKPAVAQRLCDSLQVDIAKTRAMLGWQPPMRMRDGVEQMVAVARTP